MNNNRNNRRRGRGNRNQGGNNQLNRIDSRARETLANMRNVTAIASNPSAAFSSELASVTSNCRNRYRTTDGENVRLRFDRCRPNFPRRHCHSAESQQLPQTALTNLYRFGESISWSTGFSRQPRNNENSHRLKLVLQRNHHTYWKDFPDRMARKKKTAARKTKTASDKPAFYVRAIRFSTTGSSARRAARSRHCSRPGCPATSA